MIVSEYDLIPLMDFDVYYHFFGYIQQMYKDAETPIIENQIHQTYQAQSTYGVNVQKDLNSIENIDENYHTNQEGIYYSQLLPINYMHLDLNEERKEELKATNFSKIGNEEVYCEFIEISSDHDEPAIDPALLAKVKCEEVAIPLDYYDQNEENDVKVTGERLVLDNEDEFNSRDKHERDRFLNGKYKMLILI